MVRTRWWSLRRTVKATRNRAPRWYAAFGRGGPCARPGSRALQFTLDATLAAIQVNGSTALQNANAFGILVALAVIFTVYIIGALVFSSRLYVYYLGLLGPTKVNGAVNEASPLRGTPTLDIVRPCLRSLLRMPTAHALRCRKWTRRPVSRWCCITAG